MQAYFYPAICAIILVATGCGTFPSGRRSSNLQLSESDKQFSQALAHYSQGLIFESAYNRHHPETIAHYRKAIELDPETHIRVLKSNIKMCEEDPTSSVLQVTLAYTYLVKEEYEKAFIHYHNAIKLKPNNTLLRITVADLLFQKDKTDEAIQLIKDGYSNEDHAKILMIYAFEQGVKFVKAKEIEKSSACFQLFADNAKSSKSQFYQKVGELYELLGETNEAVNNYTLATQEEKPLAASYISLASIYAKDNMPKSIEIMLSANKQMPDNPSLLSWLAILYSSNQQFDMSISTFEEVKKVLANKKIPIPATYYLDYGSTCERAGKLAEAEKLLQKCIDLYPDEHQALNYLAYMWAEQNTNLDKALKYVNHALELKPDNGAYIDTRGWIFFRLNKYKKALTEIKRANELLKDDPEISKHLIEVKEAIKAKKE